MNDFNDTFENDATIQDDFELQELGSGLTLCGKYRLEKEAGAGGMGVVWKAWDEVGERWVALKFVPPEIRHSDGAMAQVKAVFQTVQALNHQNIGPVYSLEKDSIFGYFIVKKWLEGQTLSEMLLPPEQIPGVLAKVADALDYAHSKRVMHRDVKPSNIFIETTGDVFLIDFGLAAEIQNSISQNTTSTASRTSGTRPYMAPEQWRGQHQDGQTDQYALGVVAYQFYSGHVPFQNPDLLLFRMAVLQDPPEPLQNVSPVVNSAILRALSKDRKDRFASCREFIDALAGITPQAPPPVPAQDTSTHGLEALIAAEKAAEEAKRREAEERFCQRLADLEETIQIAYQAGRYSEAIALLNEFLQYKPDNSNIKWLLEQATKKLNLQKKKNVRKAGDRKVLTVDGIEYAFRWCPPGEFMMGSADGDDDEKPVHEVKLTKGFWLLETQVTQAMWQSVMGNNPSHFDGVGFLGFGSYNASNFPVEQVSWNDCQKFCVKLSRKIDRTVKLPTEAQWEYACRAGTTKDRTGSIDSIAWYKSNSSLKPHEVRQKAPNAWGFYDMYGNVKEWCVDFYDKNYYSESPTNDPQNITPSSFNVTRGGGWHSAAKFCRASFRNKSDPSAASDHLGLRIVLIPNPED